jgi:hypothetical protein
MGGLVAYSTPSLERYKMKLTETNLIDHCLRSNLNFETKFKELYSESAKSLDKKMLIQAFLANTSEFESLRKAA